MNGTGVEACDLLYRVDTAWLLDWVSLRVERGEFVGLVGPNGAGKTTLLRAIAHLLQPEQGKVFLLGQDTKRISSGELARSMAQVAQVPPPTFGFTGFEVVLMGRYPHMGRFQVERASDRQVALGSMRLTETETFVDREVATLSGGERQRVFVARALAQEPSVLLLDEPTANLDIQHQLRVLGLVQELVAGGLTAIAAIHDLSLAARYCHRLVLMSNGRVMANGTPWEVLTPGNIQKAFGVRAVIFQDPFAGTPLVSLVDRANYREVINSGAQVHVVCGGGTGGRLLYELCQAGLTVTAGVLGAGDTDRSAADILGIPYLPLPAFSAIDQETHRQHIRMVEESDVAILCDVPIGDNNLPNLETLTHARRLICVGDEPFEQRDFTGWKATEVFRRLSPVAECSPKDIVAAVQRVAAEEAATSAVPGPATRSRPSEEE